MEIMVSLLHIWKTKQKEALHCTYLQYCFQTFSLVGFFFVLDSEYMKAQHILEVTVTFSKYDFAISMNSQETKEKVGHFILGSTVV